MNGLCTLTFQAQFLLISLIAAVTVAVAKAAAAAHRRDRRIEIEQVVTPTPYIIRINCYYLTVDKNEIENTRRISEIVAGILGDQNVDSIGSQFDLHIFFFLQCFSIERVKNFTYHEFSTFGGHEIDKQVSIETILFREIIDFLRKY